MIANTQNTNPVGLGACILKQLFMMMIFAVGQRGDRMRVIDEIERLKEQVSELEEKYCDNCQEFVCDFCHEMDERCDDDE